MLSRLGSVAINLDSGRRDLTLLDKRSSDLDLVVRLRIFDMEFETLTLYYDGYQN